MSNRDIISYCYYNKPLKVTGFHAWISPNQEHSLTKRNKTLWFNCIIEVLEVTSMGLCGCNLKEKFECSNGIHKGTIWHQTCISRSSDRQKIILSNRWNEDSRKYSLFKKKLAAGCRWNAYRQNLDRIDEMKHLPGVWIWKTFRYCYSLFGGDLRCHFYVSLLHPIKTRGTQREYSYKPLKQSIVKLILVFKW